MASGENWTEEENDRLVAAYFDLLDRDIRRISAGLPPNVINKAEIYREFGGRSAKSVEWKMRNVSAILQTLGEPWATGLLPADNIQRSLTDAIGRRIALGLTINLPDLAGDRDLVVVAPPSPARGNERLPDHVGNLIRKVDPALRDENNRKLGRAGESLVFEMERRRIAATLPKRLADLKWVARDEGDGHGYDIRSFDERGEERLIEVKTTRGLATTPFFVSRNEKRVAEDRGDAYRIFRVFDFDQAPKLFTLKPPLENAVNLEPHAFLASFR